jgi:hypothetical protein
MLRRLIAALLVAAVAMPLPVVVAPAGAAVRPCPMQEHAAMGPAHRCCCNERDQAADPSAGRGDRLAGPARREIPAASAPTSTAKPRAHCDRMAKASDPEDCDCMIGADPGDPGPAAPATNPILSPAKAPSSEAAPPPPTRSAPPRPARFVHLDDPPPAPSLVSRPLLCTWTL